MPRCRATSNMAGSQAASWSAANVRTRRCIEGEGREPRGRQVRTRAIGGNGLRDQHSRACVGSQRRPSSRKPSTTSTRFADDPPSHLRLSSQRRRGPIGDGLCASSQSCRALFILDRRSARHGEPPGSGVRESLLRARRRRNRRVSDEACQRRGRTRAGGALAANPDEPSLFPSESTAGLQAQPVSSRLRSCATQVGSIPEPSSSEGSTSHASSPSSAVVATSIEEGALGARDSSHEVTSTTRGTDVSGDAGL